MMQLIGLAGPARSGKDTVARRLVEAHGFRQFSFSDALYREVSEAFRVSVEFLQDPRIKDTPREEMALRNCFNEEFVRLATVELDNQTKRSFGVYLYPTGIPLSPRWILQTWGTEYRRAQDPQYWIKRADEWLDRAINYGAVNFVNTSVRYPNECQWIHWTGGKVWHISRPDCPVVRAHSSEVPVPFKQGDQRIVNGGSIDQLWTAVTYLLSSPSLEQIVVEPLQPVGA